LIEAENSGGSPEFAAVKAGVTGGKLVGSSRSRLVEEAACDALGESVALKPGAGIVSTPAGFWKRAEASSDSDRPKNSFSTSFAAGDFCARDVSGRSTAEPSGEGALCVDCPTALLS
jgi:hypothetical protein